MRCCMHITRQKLVESNASLRYAYIPSAIIWNNYLRRWYAPAMQKRQERVMDLWRRFTKALILRERLARKRAFRAQPLRRRHAVAADELLLAASDDADSDQDSQQKQKAAEPVAWPQQQCHFDLNGNVGSDANPNNTDEHFM